MLKKSTFRSLCFCILVSLSLNLHAKVLLGIDQLQLPQYLKLIQHKRVGLLTNYAAQNRHGQRTLDIFLNNKKINLVALFTPEDGLTGGEKLKDFKLQHIPVYSLYGPRQRPTAKQMQSIDVLVYDLQPVGVRYYTFITTLGLVMEAAKKYHKTVIVLDRPNPLNGTTIVGPITAKKFLKRFVAYYPIPMQYGLTIGELGKYYNQHFIHGANYQVIPLKNWRRQMTFNQTGLKWVAPTAALSTFEQTFLYGFMGPLEGMYLSVGRGLTRGQEFRNFGAPYISNKQAHVIVNKLNALHLPGLAFSFISFTPESKHAVGSWKSRHDSDLVYESKQCNGFHIQVTNYAKVQRFRSLLSILQVMNAVVGKQIDIGRGSLWIGAPWVANSLLKGKSIDTILSKINHQTKNYRQDSRKVWIYS